VCRTVVPPAMGGMSMGRERGDDSSPRLGRSYDLRSWIKDRNIESEEPRSAQHFEKQQRNLAVRDRSVRSGGGRGWRCGRDVGGRPHSTEGRGDSGRDKPQEQIAAGTHKRPENEAAMRQNRKPTGLPLLGRLFGTGAWFGGRLHRCRTSAVRAPWTNAEPGRKEGGGGEGKTTDDIEYKFMKKKGMARGRRQSLTLRD